MLVVANRLPVAEGKEQEFEAFFEKRSGLATEQPGFSRLELLRPVDAECYVIQAFWDSREAFEHWQDSDAFEEAHDGIPDELFRGSNQLELYEVGEAYGTEP